MLRIAWVLVGPVALGLVLGGCERESAAKGSEGSDPLLSRASDEADLGSQTYGRYCVGCHGEAGDGKGRAARFLFPLPRDFTMGLFKFSTTQAGSLPTDEDLLRTITYGLRGTAMPSFRFLSDAEKRALVRKIKRFYPEWDSFPPAASVTRYANPFELEPDDRTDLERAVSIGEEIYHGKARCWNCHPIYVSDERAAEIGKRYDVKIWRENPRQAVLKPDYWNQVIPPPDFKKSRLKSVSSRPDLYRVIAAGVGGTAMPTWEGTLNGEELWALTFYLEQLMEDRTKSRDAK